MELEPNKEIVRRLVDAAINDDNLTVLDEVCNRVWSREDTWARLLQLGTVGQAIEAARDEDRP